MGETVVGKAKVSKSWQIAVVREVRPFLKVKPGDNLEYVLRDGEVHLRKATL